MHERGGRVVAVGAEEGACGDDQAEVRLVRWSEGSRC